MTMQVVIKNEDQHRVAVIEEETYSIGQAIPTQRVRHTLAAGEQRSFYIHAAKRLLVAEDAEAAVVPAPKAE